jgi:hypothetical protein
MKTIEGLLKAVFSVGSASRLHNEDTNGTAVIFVRSAVQLSEVT